MAHIAYITDIAEKVEQDAEFQALVEGKSLRSIKELREAAPNINMVIVYITPPDGELYGLDSWYLYAGVGLYGSLSRVLIMKDDATGEVHKFTAIEINTGVAQVYF